jgi:hypothetical protein
MAIYHIRPVKSGGFYLQAEMRNGRGVQKTLPFFAKDLETAQQAVRELSTMVDTTRKTGKQLRGAQVNLEKETT